MYCTQCGNELKEGVKFCTQCGAIVKNKKDNAKPETVSISNVDLETDGVEQPSIISKTEPLQINEASASSQETIVTSADMTSAKNAKKKNSWLIVIIIILIALIIGVSGTACWMMGGKDMVMDILGIKESSNDVYDKSEPEEENSEREFILENRDKIFMSRNDLEGLDAEQFRMARHELYARHGRCFDNEELQAYFDLCS